MFDSMTKQHTVISFGESSNGWSSWRSDSAYDTSQYLSTHCYNQNMHNRCKQC